MGTADGALEEGAHEGPSVGFAEGLIDEGAAENGNVGTKEGSKVGAMDGLPLGENVGRIEGPLGENVG